MEANGATNPIAKLSGFLWRAGELKVPKPPGGTDAFLHRCDLFLVASFCIIER